MEESVGQERPKLRMLEAVPSRVKWLIYLRYVKPKTLGAFAAESKTRGPADYCHFLDAIEAASIAAMTSMYLMVIESGNFPKVVPEYSIHPSRSSPGP